MGGLSLWAGAQDVAAHPPLNVPLAPTVDDGLRAEGRQSEGRSGYAYARLAAARDIVRSVKARLRTNPTLFLHPEGTGCAECDDAWQGMPPP